jgi:predicted transcriptional regulator
MAAVLSTIDLSSMRHNQKLSYDELRDEAAAAVDNYDGTQTEIAEQLDVTRGAVSRALKEEGSSLAGLQMRILELLRPEYALEKEEQVWFRVRRKDNGRKPET